MKTASALFDTFGEANSAVNDLLSGGFSKDEVSLVSSNRNKDYDPYFDTEGRYRPVAGMNESSVVAPDIDAREREMSGSLPADGTRGDMTAGEGAAAGAGIGAALGGLGGVLMGLGLLVVPGVGPALAAGAIASGLVGAGIGGAAGGITTTAVRNKLIFVDFGRKSFVNPNIREMKV